MKITHETLEDLGRLADKADNFAAASKLHLPASLHIEALTGGMNDMSKEIKDLYKRISGQDPWENQPK